MSDFDSPWKEMLDQYFERFVAFFFPKVHGRIDWSEDHESLDQELQKLAPEGPGGPLRVDKLVRVVKRATGDPAYLHVEVQSQREEGFARRMYRYNYRLADRFGVTVVTAAVLGDERPGWYPRRFRAWHWGCRTTFRFPVRKLLRWKGREGELEGEENLFALVVRAHLRAQATRRDMVERQESKLALIRLLYERKLEAGELRHCYRMLDWLLPLPPGQEEEVKRAIAQEEEKRRMPYLSSIERSAMEKGQEQGRQSMLRENLRVLLEEKFGPEGGAFAAGVEGQPDEVLQQLLRAVVKAASLQDLSQLMPTGSAGPGNGTGG